MNARRAPARRGLPGPHAQPCPALAATSGLAEPLPPQPPQTAWTFVETLATTCCHALPPGWGGRPRACGEAALRPGVRLAGDFPDPRGRLETALADFRRFLAAASLSASGPYQLQLVCQPSLADEEFRLAVRPDDAVLTAADTEGLRRGLIWVEDEMQRRGGAYLPLGTRSIRAWVRTRMSRCFYGPVNRPPRSRDELADAVDYYPEEYLNRLAHDGVNVLWFTVSFFRTVPSRIIPEYGRQAGPRLDKLRRTVAKCLRYGIRIYPFCIEPAGFGWPFPEVQAARAAHPGLRGHADAFCTSTDQGQAYLREATRTLFGEVPDLGGLIVIPVGERQTHCYSGLLARDATGGARIDCPRCAPRQPWEVLAAALAALREGMTAVAPAAELVAWPYGQFICWGEELTVEAAAHVPPGVILQHNFETGGSNVQLGRSRPTWDYWLSYVGPSRLFARCAQAALPAASADQASRTSRQPTLTAAGDAKVRLSAKLQVSCSHEVATTQVVPVPGLLYRKYRQMRRLGVSSAMHSWYFGSYPSLMTRAAGALSAEPFAVSESAFLRPLARRDWGPAADTVVRAWRLFARAYAHYPTAHVFGYYGPMHDGPVWPLYLVPRRLPLAPTWQIGYPPSGDYIAECVTNGFTLSELVTLSGRMSALWAAGVRLLEPLRRRCRHNAERLADLDTAVALGLQFRSGHQILRFYALREQLADARSPARRRQLLVSLEQLVRAERDTTAELVPLAQRHSFLGFHSEAEGYKYFPALLEWRRRQLDRLLETEFPAVAACRGRCGPLFPRYTGAAAAALTRRVRPPSPADIATLEALPAGPVVTCPTHEGGVELGQSAPAAGWQACDHWLREVFDRQRWQRCAYDGHAYRRVRRDQRQGRTTRWRTWLDGQTLRLRVECGCPAAAGMRAEAAAPWSGEQVQVLIEPVRTQPRLVFRIHADGRTVCVHDDGYLPRADEPWSGSAQASPRGWTAQLAVPMDWLRPRPAGRWQPLRLNIVRTVAGAGADGTAQCSWAPRQPVQGRLVWGTVNPATDFGWLVFLRPRRR